MCGITGVYNIGAPRQVERNVLQGMTDALAHRGPDDAVILTDDRFGFGMRRLSIIDVANGKQPFYSEDGAVVLICNGEIFNYRELRDELQQKGYRFTTLCDVEVIVHLYAEYKREFLHKLNGQFAFAIFDKRDNSLFLVRDQFGICPLFYGIFNNTLIFGSEIKAILAHPLAVKQVNLTGLDQVFSFPGMVSPVTMFKGIECLPPGHSLHIRNEAIQVKKYWDLDYPEEAHLYESHSEQHYVEQLEELLFQSVKLRLQADVPVGFYLSGGLDSSLIGAIMKKINPDISYHSFSIMFPELSDKQIDERRFQRMMSERLNSIHHEIPFNYMDIEKGLREAVFFAESPLKETYNTCSLQLSKSVNRNGIKVILSGEGADEFFGGYVGYRFDKQRINGGEVKGLEELLEEQIRQELYGEPDFFYELNQHELKESKQMLYSQRVNTAYADFDCLTKTVIDKTRIANRHVFHKRSYLDLKLRLSDHLIADHCDRVAYANSVEGRYPFLDINVVDFVRTIPPDVKMKDLVEKYILKRMAGKYLPEAIIDRQKFGFVAPGSPQLLQGNIEWIQDMLSYERIKRQGYFDADVVERLKKIYGKPGFRLNLPYESDLLIVVLTFNIFLDVFNMPDY
ncbi:asparagine synthase (glutamine-hydrolyzing) [Chitinophaga sp. RAB17]|uniref:asparagine synthase (glutamine-hydrolyzing) n=1 Tax=Chitinophaga sp. RAB17 TaxID=3233049 RepID=UPI003F922A3E